MDRVALDHHLGQLIFAYALSIAKSQLLPKLHHHTACPYIAIATSCDGNKGQRWW
jgi:hypothetical protein